MRGMYRQTLGDASRLDCFFNVHPVRSFERERNVSPDTCALGVAIQRTDSLALAVL